MVAQTKRPNPRRNRGGGTNNTEANVSVTNAARSPKVEGGDASDANQDEPNAETANKDPTPTDNGGDTAVRFVLSSVGDEFDDSIDDGIVWPTAEENDGIYINFKPKNTFKNH